MFAPCFTEWSIFFEVLAAAMVETGIMEADCQNSAPGMANVEMAVRRGFCSISLLPPPKRRLGRARVEVKIRLAALSFYLGSAAKAQPLVRDFFRCWRR